MKNNESWLEYWKIYITHVSDPLTVIFTLYYKEMFNKVVEFYHFSMK